VLHQLREELRTLLEKPPGLGDPGILRAREPAMPTGVEARRGASFARGTAHLIPRDPRRGKMDAEALVPEDFALHQLGVHFRKH